MGYRDPQFISEADKQFNAINKLHINDIKPEEWDKAYRDYYKDNSTSDGSTADYYMLPPNAKELQDLISYRNMNAQIGEIFRECYRYGKASHSDEVRGIKKILFYATAELKRLENANNR